MTRKYPEFVASQIIQLQKKHGPMLQTVISRSFLLEHYLFVKYALQDLADRRMVVRIKQGATYLVSLPLPAEAMGQDGLGPDGDLCL